MEFSVNYFTILIFFMHLKAFLSLQANLLFFVIFHSELKNTPRKSDGYAHDQAMKETTEKEYCSTREAALRLGVAVATVQNMVERGMLEAWKTQGGHRRILVDSVERFLERNARKPSYGPMPGQVSVLIAEDDAALQTLYRHTLESWGMPLSLTIVGDGFDALVLLGGSQPDVLIVDLMMQGMNGFELVERLRGNPVFSSMDIIAISGLDKDEVASRGGLPPDVTLFGKPVPFDELRGYLRARVAQKIRQSAPGR